MLTFSLIVAALTFAPHAAGKPPSPAPTTKAERPATPVSPGIDRYSVRKYEGFTVLLDPAADTQTASPQNARIKTALDALATDLKILAETAPIPALKLLRTVPILVTISTQPRPGYAGRGACFHPSADWLTSNGYDAARQGCVEILNIEDLITWRSVQPSMVLHELSHALHWLVGFDRADVREAYQLALKSPDLYKSVKYAQTPKGPGRRAYALTDEHEYFAELSEAYLGRNDFFPFIRKELVAYDPKGFDTVNAIWTMSDDEFALARQAAGTSPPVITVPGEQQVGDQPGATDSAPPTKAAEPAIKPAKAPRP